MTDETRAFRTRLEELTHEAKENGNRISVQQVREKLKDTGIDETKLQMVCSYLDMMSVEVYDEEMPELQARCEEVTRIIRSGEDHGAADKAFHAYIAQCTHNSVITEIMPVITYSIEMYTHFRSKRLLEDTIRTHTQITEAICARDSQKAYDAMYKHVAQNQDSIDMAKQAVVEN